MMGPRRGVRRTTLAIVALGGLLAAAVAVVEAAGTAPQRGRSRGWANSGPAPDVDQNQGTC